MAIDLLGASDNAISTGTTAQRPSSAASGTLYYNTTTTQIEVYSAGAWQAPIVVSSPPVAASRTTDLTRTNNTMTADPVLSLALTAGTWSVELSVVSAQETSIAVNTALNWALAYSGTMSLANGVWFTLGPNSSTANTTTVTVRTSVGSDVATIMGLDLTSIQTSTYTGAGVSSILRASAVVVVSTAGNLTFNWAQNGTTANGLNLAKGSTIRAIKN